MGFWTDLFIKIASRMGLQLQEKQTDTNYSNDKDINLTAVISNRIATLTMLDSDISIQGENARAQFMSAFLEEYVNDRLAAAAEVALGTGDCLAKPWTDGVHIGIDIIENEDFRICESIGNYIKSLIIRCGVLKIGNKEYQRFEGQRIEQVNGVSALHISQFVFRDGEEITHQNYPDAWQGLEDDIYIPNCDNLLIGRYKCPTINRGDINSANGVRITYGLDKVMDNAVAAYNRFNTEAEKKETMIFADRKLFKADEDGRRMLPKGKDKLFQTVNSHGDAEYIHEFSPDMRTEQLEKGVDVNFRMLELLAGLSNGVLTSPTTSFATATEMKASLQLTYAFITKFRKQLVKGTDELLNAVNVIADRNRLTPLGMWEAKYDWSSSYIENIEEQFERLMQGEAIGAVEKAEVRAWVMDEDIETARSAVEVINE